MIKNGPVDSFFGFSVAEHIQTTRRVTAPYSSSFLLVGAPIFQDDSLPFNRTGGVFSCPLTSDYADCTLVQIEEDDGNDEFDKNGEWLGVTVRSQGAGGKVAACAHRYKEVTRGPDGAITSISPLGKCFLLEPDLTFTTQNEGGWVVCAQKGLGYAEFGYCQAGTGLAITKRYDRFNEDDADYVIGTPGAGDWRGSMVSTNPMFKIWWSDITQESVNVGRNSYFGFSTSAGRFAEGHTYYIGGAPRANASGAVVIMDKHPGGQKSLVFIDKIVATIAYSSFGYDVAVADLNGDGFDDIIVGAPMYFNKETQAGGAVYVFINAAFDGTFSGVEPILITGPRDSRFGMAVTSAGDLNSDGFEDFAVGAPYENEGQGAVYIYLGSGSEGVSLPHSQKITPSDFPTNLQNAVLPNNTFGYSLSGGQDLDGNDFPDLLVGALDSGSAVLLRGRPVINMTANITVSPNHLDPDSPNCDVDGEQKLCFNIVICAQYSSSSAFDELLEVRYDIEAETQRLSLGLNSRVYFQGADPSHILPDQRLTLHYKSDERMKCSDPVQAILIDDFSDIYRSIPLRVTFSLPNEEPQIPPPGEPLPDMRETVMFDRTVVTTLSTEVEFTKECAVDDGECITDMVLVAGFDLTEVSDNGNPLMKVGIDTDLKLMVSLENKGEHAYDANLIVEYPKQLIFVGLNEEATERVRYSCEGDPVLKEDDNNTMVMTCHLGNPYPPKPAKDSMVMQFDTTGVPADIGSMQFYLRAEMTNEDSNPDDNVKFLVVDVESITDIQLDGVVTKSQFQYGGIIRGESAITREDQIGPLVQQRWTVFNKGPAAVDKVTVTIDFPYEVANGKWLLYMVEAPMIEKGNGSCDIDPARLNVIDVEPYVSNRTDSSVGKKMEVHDPSEYLSQDHVEEGAVVVLDCENGTARCFQFTCVLTGLTAEQNENEATILVKARLWNATFMEDYLQASKVTVRVSGYVEMENDTIVTQTNINNDRDTTNFDVVGPLVKTQTRQVQWWIILVAVLLGLLLLILLIIILWKIGFFRRPFTSGGSGGPCGFFERKTGYKYATVTQKHAETKVGTEKTQMYDEMYNYTPVPSSAPTQL